MTFMGFVRGCVHMPCTAYDMRILCGAPMQRHPRWQCVTDIGGST